MLKGDEYTKIKVDYAKRDIVFNDEGMPISYINKITNEIKEFDLIAEQKYLTADVIYLPLIRKYSNYQRNQAITSLLQSSDIKTSKKVYYFLMFMPTQSGFYKQINNVILRKQMNVGETVNAFDELYRVPCSVDIYEQQKASRLGGFTSGGKFHYHADEYALMLDVNSMYPFIMAKGLPYGELLADKPNGRFITWYLIEGTTQPK